MQWSVRTWLVDASSPNLGSYSPRTITRLSAAISGSVSALTTTRSCFQRATTYVAARNFLADWLLPAKTLYLLRGHCNNIFLSRSGGHLPTVGRGMARASRADLA